MTYRHICELLVWGIILFCLSALVNWSRAETFPNARVDALQVQRWQTAKISANRQHEVETIVNRMLRNRARFEYVSKASGVPWYVIASLQQMEADGDLTKHLHEGSSLRGRTKDEPKGRPLPPANPPFQWEFSAQDALAYDHMGSKDWTRLGPTLSSSEGWNGWGYAKYHPSTAAPYVWGACKGPYGVGAPGKYVSDGCYSSTAISNQVGVAAIFKELERKGLITLPKP